MKKETKKELIRRVNESNKPRLKGKLQEACEGMNIPYSQNLYKNVSKWLQGKNVDTLGKRDLDPDSGYDSETTTETNQYDMGGLVMSAVKTDGTIMTIQEYCNAYGLNFGDVKSYKLVTHTGRAFYNIASQTIDGKDVDTEKAEVQLILDEVIKTAKRKIDWSNIKPHKSQGTKLFVPCIFDLHLGKLAWNEETGEDYDIKIAERRFKEALEDLITKASGYEFDKVLFILGNDLFNSDSAFPYTATTNGTPQEDDIRWQKSFRLGVKLITEAILRLEKIAKVDVVTALSNHDLQKIFYFGEVISAVFQDHPNVAINNSPAPRKYYRYGGNLLGICHGHNEKPDSLPMLMAQEAKEDWSGTWYREWLLGHIHHSKKLYTQGGKDYNGVKVTYVTSPSSADAWHAISGFKGAIKGAEAFIYDSDEGLVGTVIHNIK